MTPSSRDETRQVATRVPPETWELLQVGLLIEGVETMQDLLRPVIESYARTLSEEPEVVAIRENMAHYRDRKQGIDRIPRSKQRAATGEADTNPPN